MLVRATSLFVLMYISVVFVFKHKTAYDSRIGSWISDVCSSDLGPPRFAVSLAYDAAQQTCSITFRQRCMPVGVEKLQHPPVQKPPLHIPFALGQIGRAHV